MAEQEQRIVKIKCWKCKNTFSASYSPEGKVNKILVKDKGPTVRYECPFVLEVIDEKTHEKEYKQCAAVNIVDNFEGDLPGDHVVRVSDTGTEPKKSAHQDEKLYNGRPPTTDEENWIALNLEQRKSSITLQNDAAKVLFAFPATITTLYLAGMGAISATTKKDLNFLSVIPIIVWLLGGAVAMFTFVPMMSTVVSISPSDIRSKHNKTVKLKWILLCISMGLFIIGMILASWRFIVLSQPV